MPDNPFRLPRTVIPKRYSLRLEPDLTAFTFTGREKVSIEVMERTDTVVLNALELEIHSAALTRNGTTLEGSVELDEATQRATIRLSDTVEPGPATLSLDFTGTLNDKLHGFYRSSFTDIDGEDQVIATTQFEATDARRAFPCWDEPDLKAVFSISMVVPEELMAVSNTREIDRTTVDGGKVEVTFADTMVMSTYLVAFVVGPFEATEPRDVDGVPVRIVAPRGKLGLAPFALECAEFCLRYLRDYYGIPYPGDKIDHVAIPDFAFGAMENLGCITYRETALLVDPDVATSQELLRILDVVAHELAHMWFGDLVTMKWWDGIWLNEAFASFMEMKATDARRPDWKRWLQFGAVERPWAYRVDALRATRPVEFEVTSPDEANEMFDALTYGKGSSVLRMIEQYLGEEVFRQGVGDYLRAHSYGNTITADLWKALDGASGTPVGSIMDTWILQGGHPQLEVRLSDGGVRLSQRRFLTIPDETDQTRWKIPIRLRGASEEKPFEKTLLLEDPEAIVRFDQGPDWVIVNAGGHGFYRVSYDEDLLSSLLDRLTDLDDLERYILIDDTWAFVESGAIPATTFLAVAERYRDESEHAIWQAVLGGLGSVHHHLVTDPVDPAFQRLAGRLMAPAVDRLGWEARPDEDDLTRRLRGLLIGALGRLADDEETIARSRRLLDRWIDTPATVDPDVAQAALFTAAAHGDDDLYDRLFAAYQDNDTPQTKRKLLQALTFFDRVSAIEATLSAVIDGSVKSQDSAWVVARMLGLRSHGPDAWEKLRRGWTEITATMPPMTIRHLIDGVPALSRPDVAQDVLSFFAEMELPVAQKAVSQNLERLDANRRLRERETGAITDYLTD